MADETRAFPSNAIIPAAALPAPDPRYAVIDEAEDEEHPF